MHGGVYRDDLDVLLVNAMGTDRKLDKSFRTWLEQCHRNLDKTCMYQDLMPPDDMNRLRVKFGQTTTFFKRVTDGSRTIEVRAVYAMLGGSDAGKSTNCSIPQNAFSSESETVFQTLSMVWSQSTTRLCCVCCVLWQLHRAASTGCFLIQEIVLLQILGGWCQLGSFCTPHQDGRCCSFTPTTESSISHIIPFSADLVLQFFLSAV